MLHKEIIGLAILFYLGWIFISPSGTDRIQRFCAPVGWVGNLTVSAAALASPDSQRTLGKTMDKVTYGCEYMVWRLFYQSSYNAYIHSQKNFGEGGEPQAPVDEEAASAEAPDATAIPTDAEPAGEAETPADTAPPPKLASQPAEKPVAKPAKPVKAVEKPKDPVPVNKQEPSPVREEAPPKAAAPAAKPVRVIE